MSFYDILSQYRNTDLINTQVNLNQIQNILEKDNLNVSDFSALLSIEAENNLEAIAQKAKIITRCNFGNTIGLYTPMYLSSYCDNSCLYCGFNINNDIKRQKLSLAELEKEAEFISSSGLKHILILTGESRKETPLSYLKSCVKLLKKYFSSISIEVYPLEEEEYGQLVKEGIDGLTIYQEVYDELIYGKMHINGPKTNYRFRLDAPERGAKSKIRAISIGALLGLAEWRKEVFFLGLHAKYLQDKYPDTEIGVSVPRLQPEVSNFKSLVQVSDKNMVQLILALRLFLPHAALTLSTRENSKLRDNLLTLGVTRISAGSSTSVGGHVIYSKDNNKQFEIQDERSVVEIKSMLEKKGYQPVFKDWMNI